MVKHYKIKGNFLPISIEEKILVYADSCYKKNKFITIKERFNESRKKRLQEKYSDLAKNLSKKSGLDNRGMKIIKEVEKLMK